MSMRPDPNRWREIDALFDRALDLDSAARERFLADQCGGDEAATLEVRALLKAEARANGFLGPAARAIAARMFGMAIDAKRDEGERHPA